MIGILLHQHQDTGSNGYQHRHESRETSYNSTQQVSKYPICTTAVVLITA